MKIYFPLAVAVKSGTFRRTATGKGFVLETACRKASNSLRGSLYGNLGHYNKK